MINPQMTPDAWVATGAVLAFLAGLLSLVILTLRRLTK